MNDSTMKPKLDHLLTFWRPAHYTDLADLRANLAAAGLARFTPEPRTAEAALKDAIEEHFGSKDHLVEWLDDDSAFEVVKISRGPSKNTYDHLYKFQISRSGAVSVDPHHYSVGLSVTDKYNKHRKLVRAQSVTTCLRKIAQSLNATSPHDGVWWLPATSAPAWRDAAGAVESARSEGNPTRVYLVNHEIGPDELKAVREAITREVTSETEAIHRDILEGDLKGRALKHRREQAEDLRRKIHLYQSILGVSLQRLTDLADQADVAAVAAEIALAGEEAVA